MDNLNYTSIDIKKHHQNNKDTYFILTLALILFHLIANIVWINLNKNPLDYDPIGHTLITLNMAEYVKTHLTNFSLKDFMKISPAYPNFSHIITLPLIFIFGNHWKVIQVSGTIFFVLSILAVFLYTKELAQNKKIGFFSAFFYSFFISIVRYSRFQTLDIPLIAMIFLTMYLWERYKRDSKLTFLYLSFLTGAFAQLTKWHAFIFLFIPGASLIAHFIKNKKNKISSLALHFLAGIFLSVIIILPWYFYNFSDFIRLGGINYLGEPDDPKNLLSFENLFFYLRLISLFQTHFFGFIFLLIFLFFIPFKKKKYLKLPAMTFLFSYLFFTFFILNKNIRVIFPIMPLVALFMAESFNIALTTFPFLASGLVFFLLVAYLILSFAIPIQPNIKYVLRLPFGSQKEDFEHNIGQMELLYLHTYPVNLLYSYYPIAYDKLIDRLLSFKKEENSPLRVLVGLHLPYFHKDHILLGLYMKYNSQISYVNKLLYGENSQIQLLGVDYLGDEGEEKYYEKLRKIDVILTAKKDPIPRQRTVDVLYRPVRNLQAYLMSKNNNQFVEATSFPLPNDDILLLYVNKNTKVYNPFFFIHDSY